MIRSPVWKVLLPIVVLSFYSGATLAGETVTYRGSGTYFVSRALMPLSNGDAAVHMSNKTIATIEPSESGFIFGNCLGLGYISSESAFTANIYCTFTETGNDSFDIRGSTQDNTGTIEIIGGSGKWAEASGTGSVKRKYEQEFQGSYDYEFEITTP